MINKDSLYKIIERDKNELFSILCDLIKINSESFASHGNEAECAEFIRKFFNDLGYSAETYSPVDIPGFKEHPDYLDGRNLETRKNCTTIVPGNNNNRHRYCCNRR